MATNNAINAPLPLGGSQGGSGVASPAAHGIMVAQGASPMTPKVLTDGQVLVGSTGNDPVGTVLTAGTGITITNAPGSITIAANGGIPWVDQVTASVTMVAGTAYITDNGTSLVTYTLPSVAALGDTFEIVGKSSGGWKLQANTGQIINFGNVATASAGSISSVNQYDAIRVVCITTNTTFAVRGPQGNMTVA